VRDDPEEGPLGRDKLVIFHESRCFRVFMMSSCVITFRIIEKGKNEVE
jgi:hypothetical protein